MILQNTSKYYNLKKDEGTGRSWLSLMLIDELLFFFNGSQRSAISLVQMHVESVEYNVLQVMYKFKCI